MKFSLSFLLCFCLNVALGQSFYFIENETTLIKTVEQSPAHWYIEIYSNEIVDTTLRWKAHFDNVPVEWTISLDDQNSYHADINDLDSADFTLYSNLTFPQKLIIGAETNNTPATATVWFEIYNPFVPTERDTIYYHFIISEVGASVEQSSFTENFKITDNQLLVLNSTFVGQLFEVYSICGALLKEGKLDSILEIEIDAGFIIVSCENNLYHYRLPILRQ